MAAATFGVFTEAPNNELCFHAEGPPTDDELAALLQVVRTRSLRHLGREGLLDDNHADLDALSAEAPLLASCYAGSIGRRQTLGSRPGAPLARIGHDPDAPQIESRGRLQAHLDGFDLHAALTVAAQHNSGREPLEKLIRYCARPPIAQDRLRELPDGRIALQPEDSVARWHRGGGVRGTRPDSQARRAHPAPAQKPRTLPRRTLGERRVEIPRRGLRPHAHPQRVRDAPSNDHARRANRATTVTSQAQSMGGADAQSLWLRPAVVPNCGGKMELLSVILERAAIRKILTHLGLPSEPPATAAARAPPQPQRPFDTTG